ncbi:putative hydro-lyase [Reyranella sp.]|jgi:uncharacterized protein YcsI (UPF0317 family)|uniref:putative hydro-lyase n=1 Tax=Reyranella sp. TaxID=1929291 RepID=UPI003F6FAD18
MDNAVEPLAGSHVPASERREFAKEPVSAIRTRIRRGAFADQTGGLAPGMLQGNLAILPASYAQDFSTYCQRNPKPCPLVGVSDRGDPMMRTLGADIDIRTDVPLYNIYRDGELAGQSRDIRDLWQDDFVAFVLGCSYSFDAALQAGGLPLRHLEVGRTPSVFVTNVPTVPAGPFGGGLVVSMRPFSVPNAVRAIEVTARYPNAHGTPVHFGDPAAIGIADMDRPDWGGPIDVLPGEVPVFWACGVTPQVAIRQARPPICITHAPGCMLITDIEA